jgi:hypothetical protein
MNKALERTIAFEVDSGSFHLDDKVYDDGEK